MPTQEEYDEQFLRRQAEKAGLEIEGALRRAPLTAEERQVKKWLKGQGFAPDQFSERYSDDDCCLETIDYVIGTILFILLIIGIITLFVFG
jgi:hypothetical protein